MEYIVKVPELPAILENNGEEVKQYLAESLKKYKGIAVTAETIKAAKDDKAALNKLRTALEERRKDVKRQFLVPYLAFEEQYKELLALIDEPIREIDSQIKALDEAEKAEKYKRLKAYFEQCTEGSEQPVIRFESILNPKWQNKTMTESKLQDEIRAEVERIGTEHDELRQLYADSKNLTAVLVRYCDNYDKSAAMAYAEQLRLRDEEAAKREAERQAAATVAAGARTEPAEPQQAFEPQTIPQTAATPTEGAQRVYRGMFRVEGTKEQIIGLREYLKSVGLKYEIVK